MPLYLQTLLGMLFGVLAGAFLGNQTSFLWPLAKIFVEIVKAIAIPLIFFAIFEAVLKKEFKGKGVLWLFWICLIDSLAAITIALVLANLKDLGRSLPLTNAGTLPVQSAKSLGEVLQTVALSPMSIAILSSLFLGAAVCMIEKYRPENKMVFDAIRQFIQYLFLKTIVVIRAIVKVAPIAVFAAVAKVVAQNGFSMMHGIGVYFALCVAGMLIHTVFVYHVWIVAIVRMPLRRFWREAREPVVYSFGINSSLATVPLTLAALERLNVKPGSARLSACVGTNFNNDGILVFVVSALLFMGQAYGVHFPLGQQIISSLICVAATIVVGGIPEAGIIALSLVMSASKLPIEGIPILLTVDWFLGRCRSMVNVLGDMVVALAIDRMGDIPES